MEAVREYVIIEGGIAKRIRETTLKQVAEEDLADSVSARNQRIETGILPSGTVSMTKTGSVTSMLLWRPGRPVTFKIQEELARRIYPTLVPPTELTLILPPQLFGVQIQGSAVVNVYLWFMNDLPTPEAMVLGAPLPNQRETGKMCVGTLGKDLPNGRPLGEICQRVVGHFYASVFNADMVIENIPRIYASEKDKFLAMWSTMTKEEVDKMSWIANETLTTLVGRFR